MISAQGERFNRSKLSQDILAITDVYYDQGYAYANINPGHLGERGRPRRWT